MSETKHKLCSYGISSKVKMNKRVINKGIKNKNRKRNKQSIVKNLDNSNMWVLNLITNENENEIVFQIF